MPEMYDEDDREFIDDLSDGNPFAGFAGVRRRRAKKNRKKSTVHRKRRTRSSPSRKSHRKTRGRRKASKGGIHYTKTGQPYKILASGKARFIKRH